MTDEILKVLKTERESLLCALQSLPASRTWEPARRLVLNMALYLAVEELDALVEEFRYQGNGRIKNAIDEIAKILGVEVNKNG